MSRQIALVTGGARGIGLAAATALAREGFAIALNDRALSMELDDAVEQLQALGVQVIAVPFDVADLSAHAPMIEQIERSLGPLTTLINNAGVGVLERGDLLDVSEVSWDRCFDVNAKALFFLSQQFTKRLLARSRDPSLHHAIVNVTSANAAAVALPRSEYCASKAAASMVSKALAVRLGAENIAVYDVQPGLIATDMTATVIEDYALRARAGLTLLPRVGQAEEIGTIVATLATGRLPYTTGQVIAADGGMLVPRF